MEVYGRLQNQAKCVVLILLEGKKELLKAILPTSHQYFQLHIKSREEKNLMLPISEEQKGSLVRIFLEDLGGTFY